MSIEEIHNLSMNWKVPSLVPRRSVGGEKERLVTTVYACV